MSASLVGSEMCIRDRVEVGVLWGAGGDLQEAHGEAPLVARAGVRLRSGPVSYTHLTLPTICSV
eukprot:315698-Alexandrium_andersonii.AAC.1